MRTAKIVSLLLIAALAAVILPAVLADDEPSMRTSRACGASGDAGLLEVPLRSGGRTRPFLLYVPRGEGARGRLPLVLDLHASGDSGAGQLYLSGMAALAQRHRFAVAAPDGAVPLAGGHAWNVPGVPLVTGAPVPEGTPSDARYLLDVVRRASDVLCLDRRRVYATGFSSGARMSSQMACDFAARIAAIAPVAGLRAGVSRRTPDGAWEPKPSSCAPKRAVPVLAFHATGDEVNPYLGGDDPRWGYGVEAALARWAELDRCESRPATKPVSAQVDLISFTRCAGRATVRLRRRQGGSHDWPAGASRRIWGFFAKQALPAKR